jgi:hypothetical protein
MPPSIELEVRELTKRYSPQVSVGPISFEVQRASPAFVTAFFRVSLVVGLRAAALATVPGTSAALGLVRFRLSGAKLWKPSFLPRCSCRKFCWERHYTCSMRGLRSRHRSGRCSVPI